MGKLETGINDLETYCKQNNRLDLVSEWDFEKNTDVSPYNISYGSGKKIWWKCSKGRKFQATPKSRTCNNTGCPYCSGQKVLEGYNDFETWCKDNNQIPLLKEWDFEKNEEKPSQITYRSHKTIYWKCSSCGENVKRRIMGGVFCELISAFLPTRSCRVISDCTV